MKDYSGLFEIADASIGANNDAILRNLRDELKTKIGHVDEDQQQLVADQMGQRILELL